MTFAKKRLASLAKLAIAVTGVTATLIALPGCDDSHQADRRVRDTIAEARSKRAKTPGTEGMQAAEADLKKAAAESGAGEAMQANAKAILGQAQYEAALSRIADTQVGIDAGNREVLRLLWEINQLGNQIDASNSLVRVYKQMEPKEARSAVQQRILEATGDPSKAAWVGEGPAAVPTLTAVQGQVQQSQDAVAKQQELIKGLQAQQEQLSTQAQQAASQADAARGRAGLDLFRQAAGLRKQGADVATRIEAENAKLAQLQHDFNLAQARQQAVATAVEQFKKVGEQIESGWKGVEAQAVHQQQLATQILSGGGQSQATSSIADKSKALVEQLNKNKEAFEAAQQGLTDSAESYGAAASAASKLLSEIGPKESELAAGNPMKDALKVMKETYNPATFKVGQATAQLSLANLQVSRAQALTERARLIDRLTKVLGEAGLSLPKELEDSTLAASIKEATDQATTNFTSANELFSGAGDGGASDAAKRGGRSGKIYSLYGQALLARATGASPDQLLATARSERDLALQESPTALAALPAELVPPPSTQPAAVPGAGAATTPAATTPAEGAAPTDGTAPATTPAEGAAPAAPPADGAAPATPAAPPVDGAAPAAPATPPADGTAPATPPADGAAPAAPADGAAAPATPPADGAAPATPATPAPQ